jgi:hypothetical protein
MFIHGRSHHPAQRIWSGPLTDCNVFIYCNVFVVTGTPFGLVIGFINNPQVVTTINYITITQFTITPH